MGINSNYQLEYKLRVALRYYKLVLMLDSHNKFAAEGEKDTTIIIQSSAIYD